MRQPVTEQRPVRKERERVVQRPPPHLVLCGAPVDGLGQHVCERLREVHVLLAEGLEPVRVKLEHAEGMLRPVDDHGHPAPQLLGGERRELAESLLRRPVAHRGPGAARNGEAGEGAAAVTGSLVSCASLRPPHCGPLHEALRPRTPLEHVCALHTEDRRSGRDRCVHEAREVLALERTLPELRDRGLLRGAQLQLDLGALAVADVVEDAVPLHVPVLVVLQDCVVGDPHHAAVARQQAVVGGAGLGARGLRMLLGDGAIAVLGMQPAVPQGRVRAPLGGSEPQDRLDLRAHVHPLPELTDLGAVHDRRQALDETAVGGLRLLPFGALVLGSLAQVALRSEAAQHAQRQHQHTSHGAQQAEFVRIEGLGLPAGHDQPGRHVVVELDRHGPQTAEARDVDPVPPVLADRRDVVMRHPPGGIADRRLDRSVADQGAHLRLESLGGALDGVLGRVRDVGARRHHRQELGKLLRRPLFSNGHLAPGDPAFLSAGTGSR